MVREDTDRPLVAGVVLAAGRSTRMGNPKALLEVEGATFLERSLSVLTGGGCRPVVAVVPPGEDGKRMLDLARRSGASAVVNPDPDAQQIDSLRRGLDALGDEVGAAVVLPVDHPRVGTETVTALLQAYSARRAPIVRPAHAGRPGHPVLFAREIWRELGARDLEHGARDIIHRHRAEIEDVPVKDRGIVVDLNTPEEHQREMRAE